MVKLDDNKKFCVYVHTNKLNGKRYVGTTSQKPEDRWANGKGYTKRQPHMYNAIQKYGWDNFEHEVLITNISIEHADSLERMLIKAWHLQDPNFGYNSQSGGLTQSSLSLETRKKISDANRGKKISEEQRKSISKSKKGKPLPEETKKKISEALKGRPFTIEHKENLSKSLKGKAFTDEHKANIRKSKRNKPLSEAQKKALMAVCESNKGRKHTEETKIKISNANKGRKFSQESREKMSKAHNGKRIKNHLIQIAQYKLNTGELIRIWECIMDASRVTGIDNSSISKCAKGKYRHAGGFIWKFI